MLRHAARVLAVAACLAAAAASSFSPSLSSSPSPSSWDEPSPSAASTPPSLSCKAAQGVRFNHEVQRLNGTDKTVLKIFIKDNYNVTLLPSPPTPPPPRSPTRPPPRASLPPPDTRASSTSSSSATTTTSTTTTTTTTTTFPPETTSEDNRNYVIDDDWDYLEEQLDRVTENQLLHYERMRHQMSLIQDMETNLEEMQKFCKEAAKDDDNVVVSDGSFHPLFEEVPGVGVYRLHAHPRAWEEARKVCEREGAQLAVPNSRSEELVLTEIHNRCPRLLPTHFNDYQYLGAHDLYSEGDWETVVGYPLNETYVNWGFNQPDNAHHKGENCLALHRNAFFNDVPCWTELPFICEHP